MLPRCCAKFLLVEGKTLYSFECKFTATKLQIFASGYAQCAAHSAQKWAGCHLCSSQVAPLCTEARPAAWSCTQTWKTLCTSQQPGSVTKCVHPSFTVHCGRPSRSLCTLTSVRSVCIPSCNCPVAPSRFLVHPNSGTALSQQVGAGTVCLALQCCWAPILRTDCVRLQGPSGWMGGCLCAPLRPAGRAALDGFLSSLLSLLALSLSSLLWAAGGCRGFASQKKTINRATVQSNSAGSLIS